MEIKAGEVIHFEVMDFGIVPHTDPPKDDPWGMYIHFSTNKTGDPNNFIFTVQTDHSLIKDGHKATLKMFSRFLLTLDPSKGLTPQSDQDFISLSTLADLAISHARVFFAIKVLGSDVFRGSMIPIYSQQWLVSIIKVAVFRNLN